MLCFNDTVVPVNLIDETWLIPPLEIPMAVNKLLRVCFIDRYAPGGIGELTRLASL